MTTPLRQFDLDRLVELCKGMDEVEIKVLLTAHTKTGKPSKETSRVGFILEDMVSKDRYTIEDLKEDSPIERKMANELRYRKIDFKRQLRVGKYEVDFAIQGDANIIVECDGYDWHNRTYEQVERDRKRDAFLQGKGWIVLHYTGAEIKNNVVKCVNQIENILKDAKELKKIL